MKFNPSALATWFVFLAATTGVVDAYVVVNNNNNKIGTNRPGSKAAAKTTTTEIYASTVDAPSMAQT